MARNGRVRSENRGRNQKPVRAIAFLLAIVTLCFCGCANNAIKIVQGEFVSVTDSRPYSDSLYAEWSQEGHLTNPRYIELQYIIHNNSDEKMYLPIQTWSDSTVKSSINVYFMDKADTIFPHFYVKKSPYNSNYICKGDSMIMFITINQFQKWSKKGIDVSTNLDTLINRLHLEYLKSSEDVKEGFEIPDIRFGSSPQYYYEIPRDRSILEKTRSDRVLIRESRDEEQSRGKFF